MQKDLLTELHLPKLEFKNPKNIQSQQSTRLCYLLQKNKNEKNQSTNSLLNKTVTPSMVSEFPGVNDTSPRPAKNIDTANGQFILNKPLLLIDRSTENNSNIVNLNSGIYPLSKNSSKATTNPIIQKLARTDLNTNTGANDGNLPSKSSTFGDKSPSGIRSNDRKKPPCNVLVIKTPKGKPGVEFKIINNPNNISIGNSLLRPNVTAPEHNQTNNSYTEESKDSVVNESDNESKPFCVISEVFGNADAAFSGVKEPEKVQLPTPQAILNENARSVKPLTIRLGRRDREDTPGSKTHEKSNENTDSIQTGKPAIVEKRERILQTVPSPEKEKKICETVPEKNNAVQKTKTNEIVQKSRSILISNCRNENEANILGTDSNSSTQSDLSENVSTDTEGRALPPCSEKQQETQLITPKKTTDITKIKGWRRKQFLVEKPTTVEFYRIAKGPRSKKIRMNDNLEELESKEEEPSNVENAFVCDSLDEFLEKEADLKIGYDIPHLYAEVGIKLTSEDIVSKPNLSEKDFEEVENRYRVQVPVPNDVADLDKLDEDLLKNAKRFIEPEQKPYKFLKLEDGKRRSSKSVSVLCEKPKPEREEIIEDDLYIDENIVETVLKVSDRIIDFGNIKLESKLLGLVVYPGPLKPLHPLVQLHLNKLRSYSTRVDKNWANFAASAVFSNKKHYKRKIVPVYCCVKTEDRAKVSEEREVITVDSSFEEEISSDEKEIQETPKRSVGKIKLKKCRVLINKIRAVDSLSPWCMVHHTYNCKPCGLFKPRQRTPEPQTQTQPEPDPESEPSSPTISFKRKTSGQDEELEVSPQASFDVKIANLLAKKLRLLKFNGDILTHIDCLKTLMPDTIEFIRLQYVQESFQSSYISIWYLKPQNTSSKSRAFLTFSTTPPMPNANHLSPNGSGSVENLPKIITEIVSPGKVFSPNEYAILHCNGEIWEIHGSLNIVFEKSDKNLEQIFPSQQLPELDELQKVAQDALKVKAVKWWILDLTQKFRLIEIKIGDTVSILSRDKLLELAKYDSKGFIPLRKHTNRRTLGVYMVQALLPFVLFGPYYLLESHRISVKSKSSTLPFAYFVKKNVTKDNPLKYFINSVVKDAEENDKILDGLWLYDKMCLDKTSYIEVVARAPLNPTPAKFASIDIEHGYSLSSLTNNLALGVNAGTVKRKDGLEEFKKVTIYLYFDVFEFGYVEGELQRDNSVIITHPLDRHTKVKSHKVGEWFVRTIRRRIEFIPKDMDVKWFITKHKEDLRDRRPFNKFLLGGAHVLTKNGIFYLFEMSEAKIAELGIKKDEIAKVITENQVVAIVLEMKNLASCLTNHSGEIYTMEKVLTTAIAQIKSLEEEEESLENEKRLAEEKKLRLFSTFLEILSSYQETIDFKVNMIKSVEHLFVKKDGSFCDEFVTILRDFRIGRKYFRRNINRFEIVEQKEEEPTKGVANSEASEETPVET